MIEDNIKLSLIFPWLFIILMTSVSLINFEDWDELNKDNFAMKS